MEIAFHHEPVAKSIRGRGFESPSILSGLERSIV